VYKKQIDIQSVVDYLETCDSNTKIYIGCDSERFQINNIWWADYILVVVVHINGKNGCKIFGAVDRERDYEQRHDRPRLRLMNEVYRVSQLYLNLSKVIAHDIQIHLDINPNEVFKSSVVINEAVGYVKGMCGVIPFTKPDSWAASYAADRWKSLVEYERQQKSSVG
jgi:predicted RNase H-related nuclease YkuK (DUF458 family)